MKPIRWMCAIAALCLVPITPAVPAVAQERAGIIPTSAFASTSEFRRASISPDGSKIAFSTRRDKKTIIAVFDIAAKKAIAGVDLGEDMDLLFFRWAGNQRLVYSMLASDENPDVGEYSFSRLYLYDLGKKETFPLRRKKQSLDGDDILHIDDDGRFLLLSLQESLFARPDVWRFNLADPVAEPEKVQEARRDIDDWYADNDGVVRVGIGRAINDRVILRYRGGPDEELREIARVHVDDEDSWIYWGLRGLRAGSDMGFATMVPEGGEYVVLREFNFATGKGGPVVHKFEKADIRSISFNEARDLIALQYLDDTYHTVWFDEKMKSYQQELDKALPDGTVDFIDWTEEGRALVLHSGPSDPGTLYVFDPETMLLDPFSPLRPQIDKALLGPAIAFTYTARDNTELRAYLTVPPGYKEGALPLIVMPHGGPYGVRDALRYDDWAQLLANRGYGVVQPNFRGSAGYGKSFAELGDGQIGRAMQDDLDDVVAFLVAQGLADKDRVCLVGASYGGFAALWGAIRNPEIYRCAASWAGVTHFDRQLRYDSNYLRSSVQREWRRRVDGGQKGFDLDDVSPAVQVDRLTRPVLLAHGKEDKVVPFSQYKVMAERAERAGKPVETLVLELSGHGFENAEEEQAWYDALVAFLVTHNPAD